MPYLLLRTNQRTEHDNEQKLLTRLSAAIAQLLGKPERYVMVSLEQGQAMLFAGDNSPCAYLELKSIGLPEEGTAELSATLCELVQAELGIPQERIYIEFADAARHMWGWNGATF
jgi:phenylpyruvate tautomerase